MSSSSAKLLPLERQLQGVIVFYGAFATMCHVLYGGSALGVVLASASTLACVATFIWQPRLSQYLYSSLGMFGLAIAFFLDAPSDKDLIFHLSLLSFILVLCLPTLSSIALLLSVLVGLFVFVSVEASWDRLAALFLLVGFSLYLRALIFKQHEGLKTEVERDALSGCKNVNALSSDADQYFKLFQRYRIPSTLLVINIEHNPEASLKEQQIVVSALVDVWISRLRQTDVLYRVSDHRFVCLLTATSSESASVLLDDIVNSTEAYELPGQSSIKLGVASSDCSVGDTSEAWLSFVYE